MTVEEWEASNDPSAMIDWLNEQGYTEPLWEFTIACCRRIWDVLPGEARRVVEHAEQIGVGTIDNVLGEAHQSLERLARQFRKAESDAERSRLNRAIGFGRMVFAFDYQCSNEAAGSISGDLIEWADDADAERRTQAALLRQLVPDPSRRLIEDDDDE